MPKKLQVDDHVRIANPTPANTPWRGFRGIVTQTFTMPALRSTVTVKLLDEQQAYRHLRFGLGELEHDDSPEPLPEPKSVAPAASPSQDQQQKGEGMLARNAAILGVTVDEMKRTPVSDLPRAVVREVPEAEKATAAERELNYKPKTFKKSKGSSFAAGMRARVIVGISHPQWKEEDCLRPETLVVLSQDEKEYLGAPLWRVYDPADPKRGPAPGGGWWRYARDLEHVDSLSTEEGL
jgi:hypothetical protein